MNCPLICPTHTHIRITADPIVRIEQGADATAAAKAQFRALLVRMDEAYALTAVKNAEIRFHWHIVRGWGGYLVLCCIRASLFCQNVLSIRALLSIHSLELRVYFSRCSCFHFIRCIVCFPLSFCLPISRLCSHAHTHTRTHAQLCLAAEHAPIYPHVVAFATEQGRMKFTRTLYRELNKVAPQLAKDTFAAHRANYHSICAKMVARDLGM